MLNVLVGISLVAVHGLNTLNSELHAEAAWTSGNKLWLRDFLPSSLPNLRVLLYGYNANVAFKTSTAGIREQASNLINRLALKRENEADRPIVFIAHSLGGIVVKQALVEAKLDDSYKSIHDATYGIAFFATPHRGGKSAKMGDTIASIARGILRNPPNSFMEALQKDSTFSETISAAFRHLLDDLHIVSFFETRPLLGFGIIVDQRSATLDLSGSHETQISTDADHIGICKFAEMNGDYELVSSNIIKLVRMAEEAASKKSVGQNDPLNRSMPLRGQTESTSMPEEEYQRYLRALKAVDPEVDKSRIEGTKDPLLHNSCSWIFGDQAFLNWSERDGCQLMWLHGDPGKGKTMMAIGIIQELSTRLSTGVENGLLAYFFCQNAIKGLNATTDVLRGLIFMLIRQQKTLIHHLVKRYVDAGHYSLESPNALYTLLELFFDIVNDPRLPKVYLIIDALDECDTEIHILLDRVARNNANCSNVKWLVTSRNDSAFEERFIDNTQLHTSLELNSSHVSRAVDAFIDHKLEDLTRRKRYTEGLKTSVRNYLTEKADGTFLWVALVCKALKDVPTRKTMSVLQRFPAGLEALYDRMMAQLQSQNDDEDVGICEQILRLVTVALRPMHLTEVPILGSFPMELHADQEDLKDLIRRCGSFVTIREDRLYFVHQSAKDYLTTGKGKCVFRPSHEFEHRLTAELCMKLISESSKGTTHSLQDLGMLTGEIHDNLADRCIPTVTRYACLYWLKHFRAACDDGVFGDDGPVYNFFQIHLIFWLECLAIMGSLVEGILMIKELETDVELTSSPSLRAFVHDIKRFILKFRPIIEEAPLQIYASALVFSPSQSLVRKCYSAQLYSWLRGLPKIEDKWSPALQTLEGHTALVSSVNFSPDGELLASASLDESVRLWEPSTGQLHNVLDGCQQLYRAVAFSPTGNLLASGCTDGALKLRNPKTMEVQAVLMNLSSITNVAFSPKEDLLAVAFDDATVCLWGFTTQEARFILRGHTASVCNIEFSPDGQLLASSSEDATIRLWDPRTGDCQSVLHGHNGSVWTVAYSPNSQLLASASSDRTVWLWSPKTGKMISVFGGHTGLVHGVRFSPDSSLLASSSADRTVRLWDCCTGNARQRLRGHTDTVEIIEFSPDGELLASGSKDCTIRLWDIRTGEVRVVLQGHSALITCLQFSPNGLLLASGSGDYTVRLWDTNIVEAPGTQEGLTSIQQVVFSPDGKLLASYNGAGTVQLWNPGTGDIQAVSDGPKSRISNMVFSPDGRILATGSDHTSTVYLWSLDTGMALKMLDGHIEPVSAIAFSPNGELFGSGSENGTILLWDLETGEISGVLEGNTSKVMIITFSPDSQLLASGFHDSSISIWDSYTGTLLGVLVGDILPISAVAFLPDGQRLASASRVSGTILIWEFENGNICGLLEGHKSTIVSIAISPDGLLATSSRDNTIRFWDLDTMTQICQTDAPGVTHISFAIDGSHLVTNIGPIYVTFDSPYIHDLTCISSPWSLVEKWLTCHGYNILWLPPEFRPVCFAFDGNIFAFGLVSGRVIFLQIDPNYKYDE